MDRAERRRLEREQTKHEVQVNPLEQWHRERESYIVGLVREAIERTTGSHSIPLEEAIERASRGEGPFWSFEPKRRDGEVIGGHTLIIERYEDDDEDVAPEDRWPWSIWLEGGRFSDEDFGVEDSLGPGDDLSEHEHLRFVPVPGKLPVGMMLSFSLAHLLGRPQDEIDNYL